MSGYSQLPEGERGAALGEEARRLVAAGVPGGTEIALRCIDRLCPAALGALLAAGVKPGDVISGARSARFSSGRSIS